VLEFHGHRAIEVLSRRDILEFCSAIATRHGATIEEVLTRDRSKRVAFARSAIWHALLHHKEFHYASTDVGDLFGRDHSTVLSGAKAYGRWLEKSVPTEAQP
jgi:chromosomal replication initiation ATPase DnaA